MTKNNSLLKSVRESAGMRLAVLFGSFFILLLLSSILTSIINNLSIGSARDHVLISSAIQCILAFCIPAFLLAKFSSNKSLEWLKLTRPPKLKAIIGVLVIYFVSMPAMEWLIEWNANLHLPDSFASLEKILRNWEESSENTTKIILDAHGWAAMVIGILIIGFLTGFSEEVFFRGGLQGIFTRSSLGKGTSIWLVAIIFSVMHFQFFGFFPRLLMGAFFGYLLVWTKSLWIPIFAHILNNSAVVVTSSIFGYTAESFLTNEIVGTRLDSSLYVFGSVLLTFVTLFVFKETFFSVSKSSNKTWQKNQLPPVSGRR